MQVIDAERDAIDKETKLFNYWFFQMGGKACGANASSDYFYETTGVGHTDGVQQSHEDEDSRAEAGLMSAMEDAGSSNMFAMQLSHQAAP